MSEVVESPFKGMAFSKIAEDTITAAPVETTTETTTEEVAETTEQVVESTQEAEQVEETTSETTQEVVEEPKEEDGIINVSFGEEVVTPEINEESLKPYKDKIELLEAELAKAKEVPTLDPRIAKLNDIVQNGGDINQSVWDMQSKEYDKINITNSEGAIAVLKDKLKYIDGDDNDLIGFYFEQNFPVLSGSKDADDFDSDEEFAISKKREEMLLRKEAKQVVPKLKEFQEGMRLPTSPQHNKQEEYQKAIQDYKAMAVPAVNEINSFDIPVNNELSMRIPIAGEAAKYATSIATEPENQAAFFNRYRKEDGNLNFEKLKTEMYYLEAMPQIHKALIDQGISMGKKAAVLELNGENATTVKKQITKTKSKSPFQGMAFSKQR